MGKIKNNVVTKGFSGKFGEDITFRQVDGKTVFAKRTLTSVAPSERQTQVRNKFAEASQYAAAAIANPQVGQDYKIMAELQGLKSAYVAALTDFLSQPEIGGLHTRAYTGKVGDMFTMTSKILYKITEIKVTVLRADGTVLESGKAEAIELKWRYVATVANPQVAGTKLVLVARDREGKESTLERVL
jgi:hypothetical protein